MEIIVLSVSGTLLTAFFFLLDDLKQDVLLRRHIGKRRHVVAAPAMQPAPSELRKAA
jgi:hypothetical protein